MKKLVLPILLVIAMCYSCEPDEENGIKPTANFTYLPTIQGPTNQVQFTNKSENATSYLWEFGDEESSTDSNPNHVYGNEFPYVAKLTAYNGDFSDTKTDTIWDFSIVYKPNIYIYPEETIDLCVNLSFPKGGEVVESIPEYASGWCVNVAPSGKINSEYDFLFYESIQPNIWQTNEGWCISKENLGSFFLQNMDEYGFNQNEIDDFIEYWIPLLKNAPFYKIYPQKKSIINRVIELSFTQNPTHINRMFYVVKESVQLNELAAPEIISFNKSEFYVNEWGVILN